MKLKPQGAILIALGIFLSGIVLTSLTGLWQTESDKIPARLSVPTYEGQYDPGDIRGSYSFSEISALYQIPLEDLADAFGVDRESAPTFLCKDLEAIYADSSYEIGTGSVRLFVACYLGLPYQPSEDTYLTEQAVQIILERGSPSQEQRTYLADHTPPSEENAT